MSHHKLPPWRLILLVEYLAEHPRVSRDALRENLIYHPQRRTAHQWCKEYARTGTGGGRTCGYGDLRKDLVTLEKAGFAQRTADDHVEVLAPRERLLAVAQRWRAIRAAAEQASSA